MLEDYSFNKSVLKWIKKNGHNYDIINVQGRSGFFYPEFNKSGKYPPCVTTFHGTASGEYTFNKDFASNRFAMYLHKLFSTKHEEDCLKYSDAVIAVSNEMKTRLNREFGEIIDQSQLIYNGVDMEDYMDNTEEQDDNLLVFVGRLAAIKGVNVLIDALNQVNDKVKLVIIGGGPDEKQYKQQVISLGLQNRITFTGSLPFSEVRNWLQKSYAFAMPSFHESQGIVAMEANAFGKPVIASNIDGINEVIQDNVNGLMFEKANAIEMAEKINQVFTDKKLAKRLGDEGTKMMRNKFDWELLTKETLGLYAKVIAAK